jgi:CDP-glucose 4,6-dehydratase
MDPGFWRGKRVFVTGHTGFKGSWLVLWLQGWGANVTGFSLAPPTDPSLFEAAGVARGMRDMRGDVRDASAVSRAMHDANPEIVIHMAAQSLVRRSYDDPAETFATNVLGTVHVLEAARGCGDLKAIVVVTSDKCYENRGWVRGYRESDSMGGFDPYSSSKGCAELVTAAYRSSFFSTGAALASARAGNVIGGGDWAADRLVPDAMRAFGRGDCVEIRNPGAIRPWQYVLEPLGGYLLLAEQLCTRGPEVASGWNFGPQEEDARAVGSVVGELARLWGEAAAWRLADGSHPHEAQHLRLDCTKARTLLDWRPRIGLDEALAWTVDWYREWLGGADMHAVTARQIERFHALAPVKSSENA